MLHGSALAACTVSLLGRLGGDLRRLRGARRRRRDIALDLLLLGGRCCTCCTCAFCCSAIVAALLLHLGELALHLEQLLLHLGDRFAQRLVLALEPLDGGGIVRARIGGECLAAGDRADQDAGTSRARGRAAEGRDDSWTSAPEKDDVQCAAAAACWHCAWLA